MMRTLVIIVALVFPFIAYLLLKKDDVESTENIVTTAEATRLPIEAMPASPLLGETMLSKHGKSETPAELDIEIMSQFIQAATLENRHVDTFNFATNADLTEILLGKKGMSHPVITTTNPVIGKNEYGEKVLLDRWSTPYLIHLVHRNKIEVISAGPDKIIGNKDDLRSHSRDRE